MLTAYDIAYIAALTIASPYIAYRLSVDDRLRSWTAGRIAAPPLPVISKNSSPIWVHCASVGELNAARTFIESLDERFPGRGWLISTFTESGFEQARRKYGEERVFYCPFDFSPLVERTLDRVRPACIVLVELEFWPNLLHLAHRRGAPALLVNGRIRPETVRRHKILGPFTGSLGSVVPHICCVQNELYRDRFRALGMPSSKINVTGNMKYDSVVCYASRSEQQKLRKAFRLTPDEPLLVAGSVWPGEESALLSCYSRLREIFPRLRLLIAPRHIERAGEIERKVKSKGFACMRRSESDAATQYSADDRPALMLDTVGELVTAYSLAAVAFVGRSLVPGGGQNMLEPAALGVPCVFGPYIDNFSAEAELLLKAGAAWQVNDENQLFDALKKLLSAPERAMQAGEAGRAAVQSRQGATGRNLEALAQLIDR